MFRESVEHPAVFVLSQMQKWRVMPDQPGEVWSDQRFSVETEYGQGDMIHCIVRCRETCLQSLTQVELAMSGLW
ncbi:hypothetical protein ADL12_23030 [Streptomyces regalis]|uniref:Uncharacterized protein n=1 Tax=Streptomyces regalis TaxID=68262 RepID=A0A101JSR6_9ACTN|nr:hypothetical protein ADL12_23030 [Streptomyces regalis]